MRISYYNKKPKLLETIQLKISRRGCLLWIITPKTVRVFGFWNKGHGCCESRKFYQHWGNDHCGVD